MMMDGRMKGRALNYRPVSEAELSGEARARAYGEHARFDERMLAIRRAYLANAVIAASADSPWFALRVDWGREIAVENQMKERGIECMVPLRKGKERWIRGRKREAKSEPAITGYVLVRFALSVEACLGILAIEHAVALVGTESQPFPISHSDAMKFWAMADAGQLDWERISAVAFRRGEKVRVSEGVFGGFTGQVIAVRADQRGDAVVEVDVFGRKVPVTLPLAILEKLCA